MIKVSKRAAMTGAPVTTSKIRGLDAIRFVCALWVVLGHYNGPTPSAASLHSPLLRALDLLTHVSFVGVAAVMVFFVISGFCIRYPFRHGETPDWGEYFLRRYVRIGIPLIVAVVLTRLGGRTLTMWEDAVLWSLYAEITYYTIYPALAALQRRLGWNVLLAAAFTAAGLVMLTNPHAKVYAAYGVGLNWIVGLPCWLLGCRLADQADALSGIRVPSIGFWRLAVWGASCLCSVLRFHGPIGYPVSMTLFGVLVFFWLRQEIRHFRFVEPPPLVEKAGAWSYSLYLAHFPAYWLFRASHGYDLPLSPTAIWIIATVFALLMAYVFYLLVERPSHWLARRFKRGRGGEPSPPAPASGEPHPSPALAIPSAGGQD